MDMDLFDSLKSNWECPDCFTTYIVNKKSKKDMDYFTNVMNGGIKKGRSYLTNVKRTRIICGKCEKCYHSSRRISLLNKPKHPDKSERSKTQSTFTNTDINESTMLKLWKLNKCMNLSCKRKIYAHGLCRTCNAKT